MQTNEFEWEGFGKDKFVSKKSVPIKSWRVRDDEDNWFRFRVCTVWEFGAVKFTSTPAVARLVKDEQKRIGILITGTHGGLVKVGKKMGVFQSIFTSFNTINKKAKKTLLADSNLDFFEEGDFTIGREINDIE